MSPGAGRCALAAALVAACVPATWLRDGGGGAGGGDAGAGAGDLGGAAGAPGIGGIGGIGGSGGIGGGGGSSSSAGGGSVDSPLVPAGTYFRSYDSVKYSDKSHPATVSDFRLDRFEITVGRFRAFVNAGKGTQQSPPAAGAGAHPLIPGSGWDSAWNQSLVATTTALKTALLCAATPTWTDAALANENLPLNCLTWFEAFAFCASDGGRLPTEAEWNYAAAGGSQQREYPWGKGIDDTYAVYNCLGDGKSDCSFADILNVGSRSPKGNGRWGHADLAGNVWEWNLDWHASYADPCTNCANLTPDSYRILRGGAWHNKDATDLLSSVRRYGKPTYRGDGLGARCARTPVDSPLVTGGTYYRSYDGLSHSDKSYPATVSDFRLDRFEVTVGRFREFVNDGKGTQQSPPADGAGAHPLVAGSGWDSAWNASLKASTAELKTALKCGTYPTWTDAPLDNEILPMSCITWFEAFAFCAWDGGRLPTETEWNYAATGGGEQRQYPWGKDIDNTYLVHACKGDGVSGCSFADILPVGSRSPKGDGRWGQADLAGSVWEWNFDAHGAYLMPCTDCARITAVNDRTQRGGGWASAASTVLSSRRQPQPPANRNYYFGARCARTP